MNAPMQIGTPPWSAEEMRESLEEFAELYERRPIRDNHGGMKSPHMFQTWFVARKLNPSVIIESGVFKGQGTWLFEQACPNAELHCVDINLGIIEYRSERAAYYDKDFTNYGWRDLPRDQTLLFFDDHQNAYRRLAHTKWLGFKHVMFEDNYPSTRGDCYSLKKALNAAGFPTPLPKWRRSAAVKRRLNALRGVFDVLPPDIPPNTHDGAYVRDNVDIYQELPPVFKPQTTRWGDAWEQGRYPTPEPLLTKVEKPFQQVYLDEAQDYTWICYVKLK